MEKRDFGENEDLFSDDAESSADEEVDESSDDEESEDTEDASTIASRAEDADKTEALARHIANCGIGDSGDENEFQGECEWRCCYCGYDDPKAAAKCGDCGKWFCNGKGGHRASHIILHLVQARHKKVMFHPDSPLGTTYLECFHCQNQNVFALGYIPAKKNSVLVILCRHNCAAIAGEKEDWADAQSWKPFIEDKQFLDWMVACPSEDIMKRYQHMSLENIAELENLWKSNANATVDDIGKTVTSKSMPHVMLRYTSARQYRDVFTPLINGEAQYDKKLKNDMHYDNVTVKWSLGLNRGQQAIFLLPNNDWEVKLVPGDELRLKHEEKKWEAVGVVLKVPDSIDDHICVMFRPKEKDVPSTVEHGFRVECVWKPVTYDRMHAALRSFAIDNECMKPYIRDAILGTSVRPEFRHAMKARLPEKFSVPTLPKLNQSQENAVKIALQRPLSLIQGPPGTGKTVTSASIVYHLVKMFKEQVLVCAPSNIAVDQLAEKLHKAGLKVIRLCAKSRESVDSNVDFLTLHHQMLGDSDLKKLQKKRDEKLELHEDEEKEYRNLRARTELKLLRLAEVVCATCIGVNDPRIRGMKFTRVLIDESTQAIEPEALVAITKGAEQVVLVGDHCQLGPVVMDKDVAQAGMASSLFERLVVLGNHPIRLQVQYRMHPILSDFPSCYFYEGTLQNGVTEIERTMDIDFPWPDKERPIMFYNVPGTEEIAPNGTSFINRSEGIAVEKIVSRFLRAGVKPQQIGVITPYDGQKSYILQYLHSTLSMSQNLKHAIEVASVDAFQGREKDLIIMTCVRSNAHQGIGFLKDPRRLNVALTRAKYGLIIVGNALVLSTSSLWNMMLHHCRLNRALVEGPLDIHKQFTGVLPKPKRPKGGSSRPKGRFLLDGAFITADDEIHNFDMAQQQHANYGGEYYGRGGVNSHTNQAQFFRDPMNFIAPETINSAGVSLALASSCYRNMSQAQVMPMGPPPIAMAGQFNPYLAPMAHGQWPQAMGFPGAPGFVPPGQQHGRISHFPHNRGQRGVPNGRGDMAETHSQAGASMFEGGMDDMDNVSMVGSETSRVSSWNLHPSMRSKK